MKKIIEKIIELLQKLLGEVEPERANNSDPDFKLPKIENLDTGMRTRGSYKTPTGRPKGLVVHFTAGRWDKGKQDAINTLRWLAGAGLGCIVMDKDGNLLKDKNQDLNEVAYHAGSSEWKGKKGISFYCLGLELCNAGKLNSQGKAWFGQEVPKKERREITDRAHGAPGLYHAYSKEQEKALMNFIKWQMDTNPEFDPDWIVGHHEIAPNRKTDPGGSLSITMNELRAKVKRGDYSI